MVLGLASLRCLARRAQIRRGLLDRESPNLTLALFRFKKALDFDTIAFYLLFDKYYLIIEY